MNKTKWLALATSDDKESLSEIFKGEGYEFALDGFRMHVAEMDYDNINLDDVDIEYKDIIPKAIKINQEAVTVECFGINPVYLIEALQAWTENTPDEPIVIEYCHSKESGSNFIRIQNSRYDDPKQAIIMCMLLSKKERE